MARVWHQRSRRRYSCVQSSCRSVPPNLNIGCRSIGSAKNSPQSIILVTDEQTNKQTERDTTLLHMCEHSTVNACALFDFNDVGARLLEAQSFGAARVHRAQTHVAEDDDEGHHKDARADRRDRHADRDGHRLPRAAQRPRSRAGGRRR